MEKALWPLVDRRIWNLGLLVIITLKATPFSLLASGMLFGIIQHIKLREPKNYNGLQVASDFGDQDAWSFDST
jgi:hypothetical protein